MFNEQAAKGYCEEEISKIENYNLAIVDDEFYICYHRYQTHNEDGTKRDPKDYISSESMKKYGVWYHRPAKELIFIKEKDYNIYKTEYDLFKLDQKAKEMKKELKSVKTKGLIYCIEQNRYYKSIAQASKYTGCSVNYIKGCLTGKAKHKYYYNFTWDCL